MKMIGNTFDLGVSVRGVVGYPSFLGLSMFGYTPYGYDSDIAGIYQMRRCVEGRVPVRMNFYKPVISRTELQQSRRALFSYGVSQWHLLDSATKEEFNLRATAFHFSGFNLFMRQFMRTGGAGFPTPLGFALYGRSLYGY